VGKGSWSLIGRTWSWRSSLLSLASVAPVGASPLSAKRPLASSYLHHLALAFYGGNASRLLAQSALPAKPVLLSSSRGDSWDAGRQIARPVACPISHPHDTLYCYHLFTLLALLLSRILLLISTRYAHSFVYSKPVRLTTSS
jgi:hypothetical protein